MSTVKVFEVEGGEEKTFSCRVCSAYVIANANSFLERDKTCLTCYVTVSDALVVDQYISNLEAFQEYIDGLAQ